MARLLRSIASIGLAALLTGCATVTTIQSIDAHSARIYSGTRLDLMAISEGDITLGTFRTSPPPLPWLDLPFSFVLDTVMLPLTLGISVNFGR